jgi:tRNA (cytosine38-C5)-methyltransferase
MRALELFAGIGGLKLAAPAGLDVVAAFDQDEAAALTHEANHGTPVIRADIASITARALMRHEAEAWLLSPPCQPFTRRGRQRDVDDPRCAGFLRVARLLPVLRPRRVLVENVVGFHGSRMHALLMSALRELGHDVRDVETCPSHAGAPVKRPRQFVVSSADGLAPREAQEVRSRSLDDYLDVAPSPELRLPESARARVHDHFAMAGPDGVIGTFTRSYGTAITGAGPVHWDEGGPRYFSPEEILRLHDFPRDFSFPADLPLRTRWRLAGNSVHVGCVRSVAAMLGGVSGATTTTLNHRDDFPAP